MTSAAKAFAKAPVYLYRYTLKAFVGHGCRHWPSCSAYALDAIELNGAWRGYWLMASRLARCGPRGTSGVDPAPDIRSERHPFAPWRYGRWTVANAPDVPSTHTVKILPHSDGARRVLILQHPNGRFGFEEEALVRETNYDGSEEDVWRGVTDDSFAICDTALTAEREARGRIAWLKAIDVDSSTET